MKPTITLIATLGLLAACSRPDGAGRAAGNTGHVAPQGSDTDIALACGRASVLMYIMTLDDQPPEFRYLDPRSMPGFDAARKEHDAMAAEYLGEAVEKLGVWNARIEHDPALLNQTLQENGWTIIEPGRKIAASDRSWLNLEDRVDWCIDHYHVAVPEHADTAPPPRQ